MKLESYGPDWYSYTFDIEKLVISIIRIRTVWINTCQNFYFYITIIITGNNISHSVLMD